MRWSRRCGDVVERHESLRTIFPEQGGEPVQQVLAAGACRPSLVIEEVEEGGLAERLAASASTGMDLSRELPLRAWLYRLTAERHVLLLVLHHIAGDGWSLGPLCAGPWRGVRSAAAGRGAGVCRAAGAVCGLRVVAA